MIKQILIFILITLPDPVFERPIEESQPRVGSHVDVVLVQKNKKNSKATVIATDLVVKSIRNVPKTFVLSQVVRDDTNNIHLITDSLSKASDSKIMWVLQCIPSQCKLIEASKLKGYISLVLRPE